MYPCLMKAFIQDDHDHSVCAISEAVQIFTVPTLVCNSYQGAPLIASPTFAGSACWSLVKGATGCGFLMFLDFYAEVVSRFCRITAK